jgi:hypothetical protein
MMRVLAATLCLACSAATAAETAAELAAEPLATGAVKALDLETVGPPTARVWQRVSPPGRADDTSPWKQLIWFKKDGRTAQKSYFAAADFAAGTVRELPMMPSMEPWQYLWVEGKLYIGMNLTPHLLRYDPADDSLVDLGEAFDKSATLFRMAVGPDGVLALGGGTGTDLATYNFRDGQFTRYGPIGAPGAGYVYSLSMDDRFIYCAVRGTIPWELVSINRQTRERKVLAAAPVDKNMEVNGNQASVPDTAGQTKKYSLANGEATLMTGAVAVGPKLPGPGFTGKAPELLVDESPINAGEAKVLVHMRTPGPNPTWRKAELAVGLDSDEVLGSIVALADGRLAALGRAYYPLVLVDPKTGEGQRVPMQTSSYSLLALGNRVFATGYPSANLIAYDAATPLTSPAALPDRPSVPEESAAANPRRVCYFASQTGGAHIGTCLTPAADGRVYLIARRHRYYYGFALAWFDPASLKTGVFDDAGAFNHLQIGWMAPVDGGAKLVITTYVEYNKQLPGEAPAEASLFLVDVKSGRIVGRHNPVPGARTLLGVAQTAAEHLVGVAVKEEGVSIVYRLNLRTGKTEQTRAYKAAICGETGTLGVPVRTSEFSVGPDGQVWSGASIAAGETLIFRLNPADLSVIPFGTVTGSSIRLCFHGGSLYVSGAPQIRRVKGYMP